MSAPLLQANSVTVALRGRSIVRDAWLALHAGSYRF